MLIASAKAVAHQDSRKLLLICILRQMKNAKNFQAIARESNTLSDLSHTKELLKFLMECGTLETIS